MVVCLQAWSPTRADAAVSRRRASTRRCSENGTSPLPSSASWNVFSENPSPCFACTSARSFSSISLPSAVDHVGRVEGAALGLAPRARLLEVGLVAEEPHALLHRQVLGVQPDADDEAGEPDEGLGELPELDARACASRSPARPSGARRSAPSPRRTTAGANSDRLPQRRLELAHVLEVQEVPGIDLVHRDRPERGLAEVAQVLFLALRRPRRDRRRSGSSRCAARAPRTARASTGSRTSSGRTAASAPRRAPRRRACVTSRCFVRNAASSSSCALRGRHQLARPAGAAP